MVKKHFKVEGMTCASCAISLETYLKPIDGVAEVNVNFPNLSAQFVLDENLITFEKLNKKANEIGYNLIDGNQKEAFKNFEKSKLQKLKTLKLRLILSALFSIPVFIISMFFMGKISHENWIMMVLSAPVLFIFGSEFFVVAWKKIKKLTTNMDTLVALSTGIAFVFSVFNTVYPQYLLKKGLTPHVYFESAVIIITLILLGRYLEEKAKSKTSSAIKDLMGLQPKNVMVIRNGEEKNIPLNEIILGELILLKPGNKIPVDGKVKKGESYVDESMITGEPLAVKKTQGNRVYAGTINQNGSMRILATQIGEDTFLSHIIKMVEEAQSTKPQIQKLVDKIAGIFVPVVIGIAIISFIIWYFLGPEPQLTHSFLSLITVLIIACPCALGLATPTALMVGIGKGAKNGILIKDAQTLETALHINTLVIDKTGTITEGKPTVTNHVWAKDEDVPLLQNILVAIESQSEHPLANAILQKFNKKNETEITLQSFESITGEGVKANDSGNTTYLVGNRSMMNSGNVYLNEELAVEAEKFENEAKTVVYFSKNKAVVGVIAITDQIKDHAREALDTLQKMGIEVYMLTGDNEKTADFIAKEVGIKHYKANVLPSDKGDFIKTLQKEGKIVAMAGDGINDSYALAQADVGIAMGTGTDIAMESAGITLIQSNLGQIAKSIMLSKETMRAIKQNLFWAFVYNLFAIPIAAGILYPITGFLLNPMIAGAAMSLSSISVLGNSLRLKKRKLSLKSH